MPFLGKIFNQNSDDFGITNIDLIYAVFGIVFLIKILTILFLRTPQDTFVLAWRKRRKQAKE